MLRQTSLLLIFFLLLLVGPLFSKIISLVTDWFWFQEVGFQNVFLKILQTQILLGVGGTLFVFAFLALNLLLATGLRVRWLASLPPELTGGTAISLNEQLVRRISLVGSAILALFSGLIFSAYWREVLQFFSLTPFGQTDPIFGREIGFYIFKLPLLEFSQGFLMMLVVIALIGAGVVYFLRGMVKFSFPTRKGSKSGGFFLDFLPRQHLAVLGAFLFLLLATGIYLSQIRLLFGTEGPVAGAVFKDVEARLPLLRLQMGVALLGALLALFSFVRHSFRPLLIGLSLYIVIGIAAGLYPDIIQRLIVAPNELVKETPYILHNIAATRRAFGLDGVEEREISPEKLLTVKDIQANNLTVKNVRLWDRQPLLDTFSQIQEIRTYYEFISVDNDRYFIDEELRQVMLSPRELDSESLPSRTFINERLTFTHGYGLTLGPVNQVTPEGLPVLFVKDLPPASTVKSVKVERPEIYYGELSNDYVFVKTKSKEFDYPLGEENVYSLYEGLGGVPVDSLWKKALLAARFGSLKVFLSNDITNESRALYYRSIRQRVARITPFLTFDRDPYLVISEGKLYWILDAYTTSQHYPYSQPISLNGGTLNYIRNSVKAVVDAYNGQVWFYLADETDPIIKTYAKIFPKVFLPLSEMPKNLRVHLRYPQDIFTLQTAMYMTYHMNNPQVFYNKEDQWEVPAVAVEGEGEKGDAERMAPRHLIMKLPNQKQEEYILMLPFTPKRKDNLSAWMVARNDGENYGKLLVYRFGKQKLVFGPRQIIARINQDAEISRQITLWDQRGSQVIQGPLLVIPIEESLLYVRPLYLRAEVGKIPELKRVIVAHENKIAMEETLEVGLAKIFGTEVAFPRQPTIRELPTTDKDLISRANEHYQAALRAQKEGDWARYGEEIRRLGEILNQLK